MNRFCSFTWNSNNGKPGSHHYCALEPHHFGPHECRGAAGDCNETYIEKDVHTPTELPFHLRRQDVPGDVEFEITVEESTS